MPVKVYYNSACPVCKTGINNQRQRMQHCGIDDIEWVDVHDAPEAVNELNIPLEQVRERLHVSDADGKVHVGIDAFADLFERTPSQRHWGKLLRLPVIRSVVPILYNGFARLLYRWNRTLKHW